MCDRKKEVAQHLNIAYHLTKKPYRENFLYFLMEFNETSVSLPSLPNFIPI
jgi:hypothetical protein